MHGILLILLFAGPPTLDASMVEADPHRLVEIRVQVQPPDGYTLLGQEWLILDQQVDWRQYDNGSTLVATAPPGTYQARWRGQYIRLEPLDGKSEWRVYTIRVRGPPVPVVPPAPTPTPTPPVNPPQPVDLTGDIYSIVITSAAERTAEQSEALLKIRRWVDQQSGVQHLEFPPDAVNGDGSANETVAGYVAKIPRGATLPYGFVVQAGRSGTHTHWQGEVLSAEQVIDLLEGLK